MAYAYGFIVCDSATSVIGSTEMNRPIAGSYSRAPRWVSPVDSSVVPPGWKSQPETWYASSSGMPVSGDADGDGRADVLAMYHYAVGATRAFAFPSREDGTFENPQRSWYAEPGTW
ncbi:hypothetical protein SGRIM128S_06732 [Streptomyces griseomycini]|nr:hypothetical protein GCM10015536_10370 [Streptomyces griseomycini]